MITSAQNPKIKWLRQLQDSPPQRRLEQLFIVEGVRLTEEALNSAWQAPQIFYTEDLSERGRIVLQGYAAQGAQLELVTEAVMRSASDTQTPQGILAVLKMRQLPLPQNPDFILVADQLRDPGNLGTVLRTAAAAGVQAVLLPPETADAFAPKVLRAGMGAHFRLPIQSMDFDEIASYLRGVQVYLAAAGDGENYSKADFKSPLALVIGSEAQGLSSQARRLSGINLNIPMPGGSESLNAAVAAGILMFEVVRQRRRS